MDVSLLLKLQKRVAELEQEKVNLQREWDSREEQLQQEHDKVHIHWNWLRAQTLHLNCLENVKFLDFVSKEIQMEIFLIRVATLIIILN